MGFLERAARFGKRDESWDADDVRTIAGWLAPFVRPGGLLLDLGGGTGALAVRLADALRCRVTVLDAAARMLAYLEPRQDVAALAGHAEAMPFDDDSFDAVLVSDAFHHFADQHDAARQMRRVVRPGGGVLVLEPDPKGLARLGVLLERVMGEPASFMGPEAMTAFMAQAGIDGSSERLTRLRYRFLGTVRDGGASPLG